MKTLQVGCTEGNEVMISFQETGAQYLLFTPKQAVNLGLALLRHGQHQCPCYKSGSNYCSLCGSFDCPSPGSCGYVEEGLGRVSPN